MKKKVLLVLLVMLLVLIVPIISACSCNNNPGPGTETGGEGDDPPVVPPIIDDKPVALPTGNIAPVVKYLRVAEIGDNAITLKFNAPNSENVVFEIKKSTKEITEKNFAKASKVEATVAGDGEVKTVVITGVTADADNKTYFAIQAHRGEGDNAVYSSLETVRAGGIDKVFVDITKAESIYLGEVIGDPTPLFDENSELGDPLREDYWMLPETGIGRRYAPRGWGYHNHTLGFGDHHERYGTFIAPIVDLEFNYYVECVYVYEGSFGRETDFFGKDRAIFCQNEACSKYNSLWSKEQNDQYAIDGKCPYCGETENIFVQDFDISNDVMVRWAKEAADFQTESDWLGSVTRTEEQLNENGWTRIDIKAEVRYIQIGYQDGGAPLEVVIYGYQTSESEETMIGETTRPLPTVGDMMGMCGLVGDYSCSIEQLQAGTVVREYHNFGWSYASASFPSKSTLLSNTVVGNFDILYSQYCDARNGLLIIPCLQWNEGSSPARVFNYETGKLSNTIASWDEKYKPETYVAMADCIYQYAARYGSSKMGYLVENIIAHSDAPNGATAGRGYLKWIEIGNEPNGEDSAGATPYQLAALQSAAYDGHQKTLLADHKDYNPNTFKYTLGGKNADPDIKLAMAGLAGLGNRYITSMVYWMRANRTDGCIAIDAFNYHTYFGKYFTMNGQQICVGVSPEEYGLADALSVLIEYRDKYYPNVEVWLTEFGWDTNQSYETMTSCHVYGEYEDTPLGIIKRAREIQGMWLTRCYLLMSAIGIDKATMYMCEDTGGANEMTSVGKYGTCGIWANDYMESGDRVYSYTDESGKKVRCFKNADDKWQILDDLDNTLGRVLTDEEASKYKMSANMMAKHGYYYMYTLKETLGEMTFQRELATGRDDVWVYQYADEEGNEGYAAWCPTSNCTVVENFKIYVGNVDKATLVTAEYGDIDGVQTELVVTDGYVTITVSENPCYVVTED